MKDKANNFLRKIAHFQVEHPYFVIFLLVVLMISVGPGVQKVETVASLEKMMPTDIEEIAAFNQLRDLGLGQDMIAIVFSLDDNAIIQENPDILSYQTYQKMARVSDLLSSEQDVLSVHDFTKNLRDEDGNILTESEYENAISEFIESSYFSTFVNSDRSLTVMIISSDLGTDDARMNMLATRVQEIVEYVGEPEGVKIEYTGTPIIQQTLGKMIEHDRKSTKWISTFLVFLITMVVFGSLTSAIVPILVVTLSVTFLYASMGYLGLPISTLAGGVAAMVIGIGIDFAIHIMNRFKYERKKALSIKKSIELAVVETGTALIASSLTTISAFLAFLFGVMPEMGRFGILMAMGITYSIIFTLFGLPALLVLEEKIIYKLKEKLRFGIEREFHLEIDDKKTKRNIVGDLK